LYLLLESQWSVASGQWLVKTRLGLTNFLNLKLFQLATVSAARGLRADPVAAAVFN
jgi:hypothetical protein